MQIWVDGDACPKKVKQILFKAVERTKIQLILVANHVSHIPISPYIKMIIVPSGFDEADKRIQSDANRGDLVITADIPLASEVVAKGCFALNPRGTFYNKENIQQQLAVRNLMAQLREQQLISGGVDTFNAQDSQAFADQLDRFLAKVSNGMR